MARELTARCRRPRGRGGAISRESNRSAIPWRSASLPNRSPEATSISSSKPSTSAISATARTRTSHTKAPAGMTERLAAAAAGLGKRVWQVAWDVMGVMGVMDVMGLEVSCIGKNCNNRLRRTLSTIYVHIACQWHAETKKDFSRRPRAFPRASKSLHEPPRASTSLQDPAGIPD